MNKPKSPDKIYALVTGASKGLGRCFALELAARGINTILVSLPGEGLEGVAGECRARGTDSRAFETDLSVRENILELAREVNGRFDLGILINNAGRGGSLSFLDCPVDYVDGILRLNVTATVLLTHQLLPSMVRRGDAYILNVSSMASFSPIGYKTVYPASKRFVQDFSYGLCEELRGTGVFVGVVHPGPMPTGFETRRRIVKQGLFGKLWLVSAEHVARVSLDRLFARKRRTVVGFPSKFSKLLLGFLPLGIRLPLMTRQVYRAEIAAKSK